MLNSITQFFNGLSGGDSRGELGPEQIRIATAALLFHAIAIDGTITEAEMARLRPFLMSQFQLEEAELNRLLDEAQLREQQAVDIYRFTSVLRDALSPEEKRGIITIMWELVYVDGELTPLEDNFLWRASELLAVSARDRMELKQRVRSGGE